ncbi:hypothetical protein DPMN_188882 [Dreissena polymorpha]|uniref:Uncharacterized protein n=1 Tax=Dreissena polymorpha TaxID=45954 RepID=A0A9D4DSG2_DREPO|nr:hypothetical protein DPMN_188882 [Dreissena polymorpha]
MFNPANSQAELNSREGDNVDDCSGKEGKLMISVVVWMIWDAFVWEVLDGLVIGLR